MTKLMNLKKNKKGFTLIEMIVVIIIIAILAALGIPSMMKYIDEAKNTQVLGQTRAVYTAAQYEITKLYSENKTVPASITKADTVGAAIILRVPLVASGDTFTITVDDTTGTITKVEYTDVTKKTKCEFTPNGTVTYTKTS